jgi:hypothetical protein
LDYREIDFNTVRFRSFIYICHTALPDENPKLPDKPKPCIVDILVRSSSAIRVAEEAKSACVGVLERLFFRRSTEQTHRP